MHRESTPPAGVRILQTIQSRGYILWLINSCGSKQSLKILHYAVFFSPVEPAYSMENSQAVAAIMTIKEVSDYLKVTERTIYRLAAGKQIPAFKVGGSWRFSRSEIDQWIKSQSSMPMEQAND